MADEYEDNAYGGQSPLAIMGLQEQFTTPEALEYARKILKKNVDSPEDMSGEEYVGRIRKNSEIARVALRNARKQLAAQRYGNKEAWLAAAAAFGSPTKTGSFGETLGNVAGSLIEPLRKKREFNLERDKRVLDLDLAMTNLDDEEIKTRLDLMKMRQEQSTELSKEALKILGRRVGQAQEIPRDAAKAVDRAFAKDYVEFIQTGASDAVKALEELGNARDQLKSGKNDSLTGPIVGSLSSLPWGTGKIIQDVAFPESSDVQEMVEYTIQRSLRPILGSQFTKEEGERLISRVYNNRLEEGKNAERLDRLVKQLHRAYEAKVAAANYFERYGTLQGFKGKLSWTVDDIWTDEDDAIGVPGRSKNRQYEINPDLEELEYEDLIPAGEQDYGEGGEVESDVETDETGRVRHVMPDGRLIRARPGVPYEEVLRRYETALGGQFDIPEEPEEADEEAPEEAMDVDAETAVNVAGSAPELLQSLGYGTAGYALGNYGSRALHAASDLVPGRRITGAESRVMRGLENEGLNPTEWAKLISQAQRYGVPATGLDMGGVELRALAEASMNPENPETRDVYKTLVSRQKGSRERVDDQINRALKPDDYFEMEKRLMKEAREGSNEAYRELYDQFPSLKSQALFQLMNTPSGKKAAKSAVKALRDRPGSTVGKADATGMITKPSLEFLQAVKEEMDDMINSEEMKNGVYTPTGQGRRLRELRNALRNEMDLLTTDKAGRSLYKEARQTHSGGLELRDALRFGREEFAKTSPKELAEKVKDMNFSEKDALRSGVAQYLFEQVGKTGSRVNPASKVIDTPDMVRRLELLFDKPNEFKIFKEALELEQRIYDESKSTMAKGRTKLSTLRDPSDNVLRRTVKKAPTLGIFSPTQWALRWLRRQEPIKPKEAAEILRILKTSDPKDLKKLEANLSSKFGREAIRKGRSTKAKIAGGVIGAALPFVKDYFDDEEEEPIKKARGGLVRKPDWQTITERVLNNTMFGDSILSDLESRME